MTDIKMPDGQWVTFDDNKWSKEQIDAAIKKKHPELFEKKSAEGFVSNAWDDTQEIYSGLSTLAGKAYDQPGKAVKEAFKSAVYPYVGAAQKAAGIEGEALKEYTEPWVEQTGKDLGIGQFSEDPKQPIWNEDQAWNNFYKRPLSVGMGAASFLPGLGPLKWVKRGVNPVNPAVRGAGGLARKVANPARADDLTRAAADRLKQELPGARFSAGQETGSAGIKMLESMFASGKIAEMDVANLKALTRRAARDAGIDADVLTTQVMKNRHARFDTEFKSFTYPNKVNAYPQANIDITNATQAYTLSGEPVQPHILKVVTDFNRRLNNGLTGEQYKNARSWFTAKARAPGATPAAKELYGDVLEIMDEAAEQSIAPSELARFQQYRREYRNYKILEGVMAPGGDANTKKGLVTPQRLETNAGQGWRRGGFVRGEGDYSQLSKDAGVIMGDGLPKTGWSWPRWAGQAAGLTGGMGLGAIVGGPMSIATAVGAGAGGLIGKQAIGKVAMSKPVQGWLKSRGETMSRVPKGVIAAPVNQTIAVENQRQRNLKHADKVLSTGVLNYAKRTPELRAPLNAWLASGDEQSLRAFAKTLADKLNVPDREEQIVNELRQQ